MTVNVSSVVLVYHGQLALSDRQSQLNADDRNS